MTLGLLKKTEKGCPYKINQRKIDKRESRN